MPRINQFAVVAGAMKAGTSTLHRMLSEHPEIVAGHRKEPAFFCNDDRYKTGRYTRNWDALVKPQHLYGLDASTDYTKNRTGRTFWRMAKYPAEFRIIYILRDPIKRIESHMRFASKSNDDDVSQSAIRTSMYGDQIASMMRHHNRSHLLLLDFEDLVKDPGTVWTKCLNFLHVDSIPAPTVAAQNVTPDDQKKRFGLTERQKEAIRSELAPSMDKLREFRVPVSRWGF